ncbi:TonB-dependent receptor, partial [candidate division KSB1 bacterium]|nr:TonB-dependent receptor [candidate division KSB1 bacterium]
FILNVPPGTYTLRVTFMGYATKEVTDVRAQLDVTTAVDFQLKETVIEGEMISVVAERPAVDKTMTATKVTFAENMVENVLPVNALNEILQTSVTTQSMRGANKTGVAYLVDGVNITDIMSSVGAGTDGYSNVKRNTNSQGSTTGEYLDDEAVDVRGRSPEMVQTVGAVAQSTVEEASVIAGTFNAEYSASAGVINIASKSGGNKYSGKLFVRSSAGGLDHAGPNTYNAVIANNKSAADLYNDQKTALIAAGKTAFADLMQWTPDSYEYGADPRIMGEFTFGGPLTKKGNFFFAGSFMNDHGRFPGEFQRNVGLSLKLNYDITDADRLSVYGKLDDWGQLLGWTNRSYTYMYQFWLEGQPVWDRTGMISYLKHTHVFNPASFLETTLSYVGNEKTWGYKPVDDKLQYDNYGDDWLILDTVEKANKYLNDPVTRIFNTAPGNDPNYQVTGFQNQIRFGVAGYHYENMKTSTLGFASNYTNQISFHHQLKAGVEYKLNNVDEFSHKSSVGFPDAAFKFETVIFDVNPWSFGTFVQDKIEYEGIIVNLGARFDAYNMDTEMFKNVYKPVKFDTLDNNQAVMVWDGTEASKTHSYFSPRIGISHPITDKAAMHYSWGIYTTQPNLGYWLRNYNSFANASLPAVWDADPEPEKATAYEIGINVALTNDFGVDLTAYYRDVRNGSNTGFSIGQDKAATGTPFTLYTFFTNWGYRDSRGLELNFWKRPTPEKYFGVFGLSGNLSVSYAYDKTSANGGSINQETAFTSALNYNTTADFDFDLTNFWPTYARGYNDWKAKLSLLWDFPFETKLSTMATYKSPWRYAQQVNVVNARYENRLDGESFFQLDMRLTKYVTIAGFRGGVFFEMLNVLDRENILTFDNYSNTNLYETVGNAWGILNRPTNQYGSPLAGIAREMYFGLEVAF